MKISKNFYFATLFLFIPVIFHIINLQFTKAIESQDYVVDVLNSRNIIPSQRGTITDRKGVTLAEDKEIFDVFLDYRVFTQNNAANACTKFIREIKLYCFFSSFTEATSLHDYLAKSQIETSESLIIKRYERHYNFGSSLFHLLGYVSSGDNNAVFGLEKYFDKQLTGQQGIVESFLQATYSIEPEAGKTVSISIDIEWQKTLSKLLQNFMNEFGSSSVAGIIAEAETGKVLTYVSLPSIDPNIDFMKSEAEYQMLVNNRGNPLLDKVASIAAPPGSIYKIISSYYLLKEGLISADSTYFSNRCMYFDDGTPFCEFGRNFYGLMNISQALARSSNLFFCHYAVQNISKFQTSFESYQSNFIQTFDSNETAFVRVNGKIYSPPSTGLYLGDICSSAIGQADILITPLQALIMFSKLSDNGVFWDNPIFHNQAVNSSEGELFDRNILDTITAGLRDSVYTPIGTTNFFLGNLSEFNIRSKTGTSEDFENVNGQLIPRTNGWIGGLFDYAGNEYVFTFHSRYGGSGFYISKVLRDFLDCLKHGIQTCQ